MKKFPGARILAPENLELGGNCSTRELVMENLQLRAVIRDLKRKVAELQTTAVAVHPPYVHSATEMAATVGPYVIMTMKNRARKFVPRLPPVEESLNAEHIESECSSNLESPVSKSSSRRNSSENESEASTTAPSTPGQQRTTNSTAPSTPSPGKTPKRTSPVPPVASPVDAARRRRHHTPPRASFNLMSDRLLSSVGNGALSAPPRLQRLSPPVPPMDLKFIRSREHSCVGRRNDFLRSEFTRANEFWLPLQQPPQPPPVDASPRIFASNNDAPKFQRTPRSKKARGDSPAACRATEDRAVGPETTPRSTAHMRSPRSLRPRFNKPCFKEPSLRQKLRRPGRKREYDPFDYVTADVALKQQREREQAARCWQEQ